MAPQPPIPRRAQAKHVAKPVSLSLSLSLSVLSLSLSYSLTVLQIATAVHLQL